LSLSYYSKTPVGWIMSRVTSDSDRVAELITWGLLDSAWAVMNVTTSLAFMFYINWRLALIVLIAIPIIMVVAIEFRKRILTQFRNVRKLNSQITGAYNENITGVRVVKALGREKENMREFGVADRRDVQGRLPGRLAERPVPALGADHCLDCVGSGGLLQRAGCGTAV
jgi:ATP-binding cassette, subfamily B, bacterial